MSSVSAPDFVTAPANVTVLRRLITLKSISTTKQTWPQMVGTRPIVCIVSVLHQDEGGIGKSIPDARKISRDPRDFPRAKPEGNLEGRGKSGGQRGWISQYLPSFGGARTISQHQFFYREWIRKSFPVDREGLTVLKSILPC